MIGLSKQYRWGGEEEVMEVDREEIGREKDREKGYGEGGEREGEMERGGKGRMVIERRGARNI